MSPTASPGAPEPHEGVAYTFELSVVAGLWPGDAFLPKPFALTELVSTVATMVAERAHR